jgi:alpha/beta hydrolase fold
VEPETAPQSERETAPLPPDCSEGYLRANGVRLHYVTAGAGPLVLLLHGYPEFWYSYRYQLPALAPSHRVVALDLRGYNLSDKPPEGYDIATICEDLRAANARPMSSGTTGAACSPGRWPCARRSTCVAW